MSEMVETKKKHILALVLAIFVLLLAAGYLVAFVLVTAGQFLFCTAACAAIGITILILRKKAVSGSVKAANALSAVSILSVFALVVIIYIGNMGFPVTSHTPWRYQYLNYYSRNDHKAPAGFPGSIPDSARDYEYEFFPSVLQGRGHIALTYRADEEYTEVLRNDLESEAELVFPLSELDEVNERLAAEDPDDHFRGLGMYFGDIGTTHPDSTVYVVYSNYDTHFPHTDAVFIDGDYVFFSHW